MLSDKHIVHWLAPPALSYGRRYVKRLVHTGVEVATKSRRRHFCRRRVSPSLRLMFSLAGAGGWLRKDLNETSTDTSDARSRNLQRASSCAINFSLCVEYSCQLRSIWCQKLVQAKNLRKEVIWKYARHARFFYIQVDLYNFLAEVFWTGVSDITVEAVDWAMYACKRI